MTRLKRTIWVGVGFFLFLFSSVQLAIAKTSSEALVDILHSIHTLNANFEQTVVKNAGDEEQKISGELLLQRPNKFRWQVNKPTEQLIISNGKEIFNYDVALEQVTIKKMEPVSANSPAFLFSDKPEQILKAYKVFSIPTRKKLESQHAGDVHTFQLKPRSKDSLFQMIEISFVAADIIEMRVLDHLEQTTVFVFSDVVNNISIDKKLFKFNPPDHVDVIRQN